MHRKMSSSSSPLREFGPLTQLLVSVPRQIQRGLLTYNITWTCVDVTDSWIVIGTDAGLVYLYSRLHSRVEHQLTVSQSGSEPVVRVKMKESVDHVLACSTTSGLICIFQLQVLIHTPSFPNLKSYVVSGLHRSAVICMEWSINGMRLFSGDRDGIVVCTNIDYTIEQCTSYALCKETHAIVQLCYAHRVLLVSTNQRSAICLVETSSELQQIGKQDRKIPGPFGATFVPGSLCSADACIYASRPGLRLWKADVSGTVSTTITFPKPSESCHELSSSEAGKSSGDPPLQFGVLFPYPGGMLMSRSPSGILLLDPNGIGNIERIFPAVGVLDVALNGEEVFILRRSTGPHSRPLIRLAQHPEDIYMRSMSASMMEMPSNGGGSSTSKRDKSVYQTAGQLTGKVFRALIHMGGRLTAVEEGTISTAHGTSSDFSTEIAEDASLQVENDPSFPASDSGTSDSIPAVRILPAEIPPIRIVEARTENDFHTSVGAAYCGTFDRNSEENVGGIHIRRSSATLLRTGAAESGARAVMRSHSVGADGTMLLWSTDGDDGATGFQFGGTGDNTDDIVFSSSLGKKKVKKMRPRSAGKIPQDTISTSSVESCDSDRLQNSWDASTTANSMTAINAKPQMLESHNNVEAGTSPNPFAYASISKPSAVCSTQSRSPSPRSLFSENFSVAAGRDGSSPLSYPADDKPSEIRSRNFSGSESSSSLQTGVTNDQKRRNICDFVGHVSSSTPPSHSTFDVCGTAGNLGSKSVNLPVPQTVDRLCSSLSAASGGDSDLFQIEDSSHETQSNSRPPSCPVELPSSPVTSIYPSSNYSESENLGKSVTTASSVPGSTSDFTPVMQRSVAATITSPSDEFQSIYSSYVNSESPSSPTGKKISPCPSPQLESTPSASPSRVGNADTWVEFPTPLGNSALSSLSVSRHTVWCTDRSERAFHSALVGPGLRWIALDQPASQISTSLSGYIVWRLHRGSAFAAGGKLTAKSPVTTEWREVVARDVAFVAVDDHCVWYVKVNGDVKVQKDLGRERTSYRSLGVPCDERVVLIACRGNIVWAVTENRHALIRIGVEKGTEQGTTWQPLDGFGATLSISSLDIDADYGVVWVVETSGRFWFTTGVTSATPMGCGQWWQVSTSSFLITEQQSSPRRQPVRALIDLPSKMISTQPCATTDGGLVAIGAARKAVWTCLGASPVLHVCRSSIIGHRWHLTMPSGLPSFARWHHLSATCLHDPISHSDFDVVWLQQPNGSIFCLSSSTDGEIRRFLEIPAPPTASDSVVDATTLPFVTFCATPDALWGLADDGRLFAREGIAVHCLTGLNWVGIDLTQLGKNKLVHIAVTSRYIWAIDATGSVYQRYTSLPVPGRRQTATWQRLPADGTQQQLSRSIWGSATLNFGSTAGDQFVRIYAGSTDWMVWAVDSRQNVFVREGISDDCPLGTTWTRVPGTQADSLCISECAVYAVVSRGLCFVRHGITSDVPHGEYWKQIPGEDIVVLSVTAQDSLWALDRDGQLHRRQVFVLERTPTKHDSEQIKAAEDDWEVI